MKRDKNSASICHPDCICCDIGYLGVTCGCKNEAKQHEYTLNHKLNIHHQMHAGHKDHEMSMGDPHMAQSMEQEHAQAIFYFARPYDSNFSHCYMA